MHVKVFHSNDSITEFAKARSNSDGIVVHIEEFGECIMAITGNVSR
jgi:hypothetical protein